jgi:hypothetical protein
MFDGPGQKLVKPLGPEQGGGSKMIKFKGCPKCRGELYLNQDMYGKYYNCMQCGYLKDLTGQPELDLEIRAAAAATAEGERKAA